MAGTVEPEDGAEKPEIGSQAPAASPSRPHLPRERYTDHMRTQSHLSLDFEEPWNIPLPQSTPSTRPGTPTPPSTHAATPSGPFPSYASPPFHPREHGTPASQGPRSRPVSWHSSYPTQQPYHSSDLMLYPPLPSPGGTSWSQSLSDAAGSHHGSQTPTRPGSACVSRPSSAYYSRPPSLQPSRPHTPPSDHVAPDGTDDRTPRPSGDYRERRQGQGQGQGAGDRTHSRPPPPQRVYTPDPLPVPVRHLPEPVDGKVVDVPGQRTGCCCGLCDTSAASRVGGMFGSWLTGVLTFLLIGFTTTCGTALCH